MFKLLQALLKSKKATTKPDNQTKPLTVKDALQPQTVHDGLPPSQENESPENQTKANGKTDSLSTQAQAAINLEQKAKSKSSLEKVKDVFNTSSNLARLFEMLMPEAYKQSVIEFLKDLPTNLMD